MSPSSPPSGTGSEFDTFVRKHENALRNFFRRRILEHAEVEDLVQEVFLRLARRGLGDINHQEGYLFRTALNVLRDRIRSRSVRDARAQTTLEENYPDDEGFSPERVLIGREALTRMEAALMELPERTQKVFALSRFAEMRNADIADELGISVSAVEKHITKALLHLSKRLEGLL